MEIVSTTCDVYRYDSEGRYLGKLKYQQESLRDISGICSNSLDQIILTDNYYHRIMIFNKRRQFVQEVGSRGRGLNQFIYPSGVCVDQYNNILVVDSGNNRICVFTPRATLIRQIHTGPSPQRICISGGRIFVTHSNNSISIFTSK